MPMLLTQETLNGGREKLVFLSLLWASPPTPQLRRIREEIVHIEAKIANEMYINT